MIQDGKLTQDILQRALSSIDVRERVSTMTIFTRLGIRYAISTEYVIEIMRDVFIHSIPNKLIGKFVGIAQYHGEICPCLDVGNEKKTDMTACPRTAIVLMEKDRPFFLMVDAIEDVGALPQGTTVLDPKTVLDELIWSSKA